MGWGCFIVVIIIMFIVIIIASFTERPEKKKSNIDLIDEKYRKRFEQSNQILNEYYKEKEREEHNMRSVIDNNRDKYSDYKKINVAIKGLTYRSNSDIRRAKNLIIGEEVFLKRDYGNQYDKNATEVRTSDNYFIGYVDADYTQSVAMRIREEFDIRCFITKKTYDDIPFIYVDIFYKDTYDKQAELIREKILLKKYIDYDLDKLSALKWDINRLKIKIGKEYEKEIDELFSKLYDDSIRDKIKNYSIARLNNFLDTKEAENISIELRKEVESRLNNESQTDKIERECSSIRSKISRLKKKGELSEMPVLEKELEKKYAELSLIKLSEKQFTELIIPDNLEGLKKMSENWRTKILKAENMLNYQSESKKGKEPNPMPEGNKRTKLEGRIALLKEQKVLIDSNIEKLS